MTIVSIESAGYGTAQSSSMDGQQVKFSSTSRGCDLVLSDSSSVVKKVSGAGYADSFVEIQHPPDCEIMLTLEDYRGGFSTHIGFFDCAFLQQSTCHMHSFSLNVHSHHTQFYNEYPNKQGPNAGVIAKGDHVLVQLHHNQATFLIPSLNYSHSFSIPSNHVLGLAIFPQHVTWKVSAH
ncbi:hypothetical protein RCL1_003369 [Eukaryota sp. TZLM3-RCL]